MAKKSESSSSSSRDVSNNLNSKINLKSNPDKSVTSIETVAQRIKTIVKNCFKGISVDDLLATYEENYNIAFNYANYGYTSAYKCLEDIPGLEARKINREVKFFCIDESPLQVLLDQQSKLDNIRDWLENEFHSQCSTMEEASNDKHVDNFTCEKASDYPESELYIESEISETLKQKFREVLQRHPRGIFGRDFLSSFKAIHKQDFKLGDTGYLNLNDLVKDLPDVFHRIELPNCSNDWKLFDVQLIKKEPEIIKDFEEKKKNPSLEELDSYSSVVRSLLHAYPEGIYIDDFVHAYAINCHLVLNVEELGYNDVESFLYDIEKKVPLRFDYSNIRTKIYLAHSSSLTTSSNCLRESKSSISHFLEPPSDAVLPGEKFNNQSLLDLPSQVYFPVYLAQVNSPFDFYIQLKGRDTSFKLDKMAGAFECENAFDDYFMLPEHIVVGAVCSAIWFEDKTRYRALICSVDSLVKVLFVDYGTVGLSEKHTLRYLKRKHFSLPAQAINARLAMISSKGTEYDTRAMEELIDIGKCNDLMAMVSSIDHHEKLSLSLSYYCEPEPEPVNINVLLTQLQYVAFCKEPFVKDLALTDQQSVRSNTSTSMKKVNSGLGENFPKQPRIPNMSSLISYLGNKDDGDLFEEDDDDGTMLKYCQEFGCARYVERALLPDGYKIHIVSYECTPYVPSCDIFKLFWPNDNNYEKLPWRIRLYKAVFETVKVTEDEMNLQMFKQFQLFHIDDILEENEVKYIILYKLADLVNILNIFGHPSYTIRKAVKKLHKEFDPCSTKWRIFNEPNFTNESATRRFNSVEDLCLFDLRGKLILYEHKKCEILWKLKNNIIKRTNAVEYQLQMFQNLYDKCQIRIAELELLCSN